MSNRKVAAAPATHTHHLTMKRNSDRRREILKLREKKFHAMELIENADLSQYIVGYDDNIIVPHDVDFCLIAICDRPAAPAIFVIVDDDLEVWYGIMDENMNIRPQYRLMSSNTFLTEGVLDQLISRLQQIQLPA